MRHRLSLDGPWQFHFDAKGSVSKTDLENLTWRTSTVPEPWQARFADLRDRAGIAWYRCFFEVPPDWPETDRAVILHFGAVDYYAEVWINGTRLGSHEGGYLPFEFEVASLLQDDNELVVRVTDPTDNPQRFPQFPFSEIPHGKQSWYGQISGPWQSVWLECRAVDYVTRLRLTPDLREGSLEVQAALSRSARPGMALEISAAGPDGTPVARHRVELEGKAKSVSAVLEIADPLPWSPDAPNLYAVDAMLFDKGGTSIDQTAAKCGFRTIESRNGRLYLNGKPYYMRAALDQDYYQETIYTPPSTAYLEDQLRKAKKMGLDTIRFHIKVADPRYYEVADRLGMLIWAEFPNFAYLSDAAAERARTTIAGMVERDWNHPSIIIWTIINEDWGTNLVENEEHRRWLREMFHWLKQLDPTRLVVDNSPNRLSFHVESDLADYHFYQAHPDGREKWDDFIERMAARDQNLLYSPNGDAVFSGEEPLLVSEFGVWGLPDIDLLIEDGEQEPYWMEYGLGFYEGVAYPHGVKDRFYRWFFETHFGSWRAFIEATQWRQYYALKYQIESIRQRAPFSGYVITELTDVHWEVNGIMDMNRNPRVFHKALAWLNADTVLIGRPERQAYWGGEEINLDLILAHQAGEPLRDATARWSLSSGESAGAIELPDVPVEKVSTIGTVAFTAPNGATGRADRLDLSITTREGKQIAANHYQFAFFPRRNGPPTGRVRVWTPDEEMAARVAALGYLPAADMKSADVLLLTKLDEKTAAYGRAGGRLLLLADDEEAVGSYFPRVDIFSPQMRPRRREGTPWSGYWVTSFSYLRREGPFAGIPGTLFLDQSFERVIPNYVLEGFSPAAFEERVYAGIFVGWVNNMATLIGERRYGQGKIVLNTFRLGNDLAGVDPVATALLDGLIELALAP